MNANAELPLLALADRIPRDARRILELVPPGRTTAGRFRQWNPEAAYLTLECDGAAPQPAVIRDASAAHGPFDAVILHAPALLPDPLRLFEALADALGNGGALLVLTAAPGPSWAPEPRAMATILSAAALIPDLMSPVGNTQAVIVRAVRAADGLRRMFIRAMMLKPAAAVNDKRILEPLAFQATLPGVTVQAEVRQIGAVTANEQRSARVAVLQRSILTRSDLSIPRTLLARGYIIVAEFDDHPMVWPTIAENDHMTFRAVHAVQTSTGVLADVLSPFNPELEIYPNQIAAAPPPRPPRGDGPVRVFFGALNRSDDIRPLMPVIKEAIRRYGDRLAFEVVFDKGLFDALPTEAKSFTPLCPYPVYLDRLRRCDLALLPLADTTFNRCKSDLKFIECAANEVVALASPCVYGATVHDGETGWLFRSPEEFRERLFLLLEDPARRAATAHQARAYVLSERLQAQHFRRRQEWYWSLVERKAELDAALYARVPGLRP